MDWCLDDLDDLDDLGCLDDVGYLNGLDDPGA